MISKLRAVAKKGLQLVSNVIYPKLSIHSGNTFTVLGSGAHYFVGYYDVDPVDSSGEFVLCHKISLTYTKQNEPEVGEVGLLSILNGEFKAFSRSKAINWQLGSRLRWLTDNTVIYNDIIDGYQCSLLFDLALGKVKRKFERPFWAVSADGKLAASLNFSRIKLKRPGYGYAGLSCDGEDERLTLFSIATGEILFQIHLELILEKINFQCPPDVDPYLNHVTWSPCSTKFLTLFHFDDPVTSSRLVYPILVDCSDFSVSLFYSGGFFSHHVWLDSERLLAYISIKGKKCFSIWSKDTGWVMLEKGMPALDGHPSIIPNNNSSIIVDSYPDRAGRMTLYLGSLDNGKEITRIGKIMNIATYVGALRCDLHPRVSSQNKIICDIPSSNGRQILVIEAPFYDE